MPHTLGFDFGTESVRVLVVDVRSGRIAGQASKNYPHGVIDQSLPTGGGKLPHDYALQHPQDWLSASSAASKAALRAARVSADDIVGIGVDFTSCTMLPAKSDGTPLCLVKGFEREPLAWPKLWKHHGAKAETDRINEIARERKERWLARYGGTIGLEWFFPKMLETLVHAPRAYAAADLFIEGGDWFVWQLVCGPFPACSRESIVRSTCQAGYKACWNAHSGYPSPAYLKAVNPKFADVVESHMPGRLAAPGERAGLLSPGCAKLMGLRPGIPVSAAIIDAHAGVPGAGVYGADTLVMVMGTSSCHMLNSAVESLAPGIAGVVDGGILPGYFGYETGQASVGDAFAWASRTLGRDHATLNKLAADLAPGSAGVLALDYLNGCRTPLMDGRLSGLLVGLTLTTRPEQIYRALMEATALGVRWIRDTLRDAGVPVKRYVASGGLPAKSPLLMQIYADVLGAPITPAASDQSVALGAAILGAIAAGREATGFASVASAVKTMAPPARAPVYKPNRSAARAYDGLYDRYRSLTSPASPLPGLMRELRG